MSNDHIKHACLQIQVSFNRCPPHQDLAVAKQTRQASPALCSLEEMECGECPWHSVDFVAFGFCLFPTAIAFGAQCANMQEKFKSVC